MKYLYILLLLLTIALNPTSVSAYSCNEYSIDVPDSFEIDTETLSDFTSFYTDGLTVGIRIEYNSLKSDVTTYTEQQINALAKERLDALLIQAGEGVAITAKELTSFSNNNYPCLYIAYS